MTTVNSQYQQFHSALEARKVALLQEVQIIERTQQDAQVIFDSGEPSSSPKRRGKYKTKANGFGGGMPTSSTPTPRKSKKAKHVRRTPEDLIKLQKNIFIFIKGNPGCSRGDISAALNVPAGELAVPVKKLLAAKQVKRKGERGSTQYFAKGAKRS
jgi:hypothetical protein